MVGLRLASVLQPGLVEGHFHRMDTALEIDANDVYLALLEELRCVAGLLEHGAVRIETPLHLQIERIEFSIRLASLPMLRSLPVGLHKPAVLDVAQVRAGQGLADLNFHHSPPQTA